MKSGKRWIGILVIAMIGIGIPASAVVLDVSLQDGNDVVDLAKKKKKPKKKVPGHDPVWLCHVTDIEGDTAVGHVIRVDDDAVEAHLNHGDRPWRPEDPGTPCMFSIAE